MAGDDFQFLRAFPQHSRRTGGHIAVRGAVETVPADLFLLIQLVRERIYVPEILHIGVKSRIKNRDLRGIPHLTAAGFHPDNGGRTVQRIEADDGGEILQHLVVDEIRFLIALTAVGDAMAHRVDLLNAADDTVHRIRQAGQRQRQGLLMGGHRRIHRIRLRPRPAMGD